VRRWAWVVAAVVLVAAGGLGFLLVGRSSPPPPAGPPTATGSVSPASVTPPSPPAHGAWVGAWVQPQRWDVAGRTSAVTDFEQQLGRPMDLVHTYHPFLEPFPSPAEARWLSQGRRLLISWAGADTQQIVAGTYDDQIRARARELRALDQPVLLRWRWEMNRPNLSHEVHDPQTYVAAWQRIHTIFEQEGATNVGWVWCPMARDFTSRNGPAYYPGNADVDWLCADVYAGPNNDSFATVSKQFRDWAATIDKPVMIGELGAQRPGTAARQEWWTGAFDTIQSWPQVKAVVLFESRGSPGQPYDLALVDDPKLLATVASLVARPYFHPTSP
jgi:hypothetical protein